MSVFDWWQFTFMQNAFYAIWLISPLLGFTGALVINARMSFFADAIGHSALTGMAIGALLKIANPGPSIFAYSIFLALAITYLKHRNPQKTDSFISLLMSFSVALGIVILSREGQFNKFSNILIGDLLSITYKDLIPLVLTFIFSFIFYFFYTKKILLTSLNQSLARSRGINVFMIEFAFSTLVALIVSTSISLVGLLVINSLLVLPAATANNLAKNARSYLGYSIFISLLASIIGLDLSYRLSSATGATIVLTLMAFFLVSLIWKKKTNF